MPKENRDIKKSPLMSPKKTCYFLIDHTNVAICRARE